MVSQLPEDDHRYMVRGYLVPFDPEMKRVVDESFVNRILPHFEQYDRLWCSAKHKKSAAFNDLNIVGDRIAELGEEFSRAIAVCCEERGFPMLAALWLRFNRRLEHTLNDHFGKWAHIPDCPDERWYVMIFGEPLTLKEIKKRGLVANNPDIQLAHNLVDLEYDKTMIHWIVCEDMGDCARTAWQRNQTGAVFYDFSRPEILPDEEKENQQSQEDS